MISARTYARMDRDDRLAALREMSGDPLPTGRREEPAPSFIAEEWQRAAWVAEQRKFASSRATTYTEEATW